MRREVGPGEAFARSLNREAELVEESWDVMVVVADAELPADQLADHGAGPNTRGEAGCLRAALDEGYQHRPLAEVELGRGAGRRPGAKAVDTVGVIAKQPLVDARARDAERVDEVEHALAVDVREHRARSPPLVPTRRTPQEAA